MNSLIPTFAIVILALFILVPILGSLTLCLPKWWRAKVRRGESFRSVPPVWDILSRDLGGPSLFEWLARLGIILIIWPLLLFASVIYYYTTCCFALIERKCPYGIGEIDIEAERQHTSAYRWHDIMRTWQYKHRTARSDMREFFSNVRRPIAYVKETFLT